LTASCASTGNGPSPDADAAADAWRDADAAADAALDADASDPSDASRDGADGDHDGSGDGDDPDATGVEFCGTLEPTSIRPDTGHASLVSRNFGFHGDKPEAPERSPLRLFEDGIELGPAHAPHDDIRTTGGGAFSHWGNTLYFSASDNSDPATNGRTYTFAGPCWRPVRIEPVFVAASTTNYATFQSHNQKVVETPHGIFLSYITSDSPAAWHLVRSTDGGATFRPVCESSYYTKPPAIETDGAGNIYLVHSEDDRSSGHPAYFYRFEPPSFPISASSQIPDGAAGKFTTYFDRGRGQLYLFTFWDSPTHNFFAIDRNGNVLHSRSLTQPGPNARIQYPHLAMDGYDLYAGWTTQAHGSGTALYWSIQFMRSGDGGFFWRTASGSDLALPVVADNTGPTTMITLNDEFSVNTWLSSLHVDPSGIHFMYYAASPTDRQHYVRYSRSGTCEINIYPSWSAGDTSLASLDGFFVSRPDGILFASAHTRDNELAVFLSDDGGRTWLDYALSEPLEAGTFHYSIGGSRELGPSRRILGSYTKQRSDGRPHEVWFFGVDAELWTAP
jgi:hypothetical protein